MHGQRIGIVSIENEHAELAVGGALQREARVTEHDVDVRRTVGKEREVARVAGDSFDGRIDLVKSPLLAAFAITGDGAGTEADDADVLLQVGRYGVE